MPQIFESLKIFKIRGPLFWGHLWGSGAINPFFKTLCGMGLISPDVSTTFPASFFTVMPKRLTTGPKSMSDRTCRITTTFGAINSGKLNRSIRVWKDIKVSDPRAYLVIYCVTQISSLFRHYLSNVSQRMCIICNISQGLRLLVGKFRPFIGHEGP